MSEQTESPKKEIYYDQRSVTLRTTQDICFVQEHDKAALLNLVMKDHKEKQVVIVVRSKKKADALSTGLKAKEHKVLAVHGNHRQEQQQEAAKAFNLAALHVIITTDMILKTLALDNIDLLLSYDLPELPQEYYDRLAVLKEKGNGLAFVNKEDEAPLVDIEFNMKKEITEIEVPGFISTPTPKKFTKQKKDRTKKPRHRKNKIDKDLDEA